MKTIKISLFLPNLHGGGAERMMLNLAKGLLKFPVELELIVANLVGDYISEIPEGAKIVNLNSKKTIFSTFKFISHLKKNKPDVLISTLRRANIVAVLSKILTSKKFKLILREANSFSEDAVKNSSLSEKIINSLCKLFYPKADAIVAVSEKMSEEIGYHFKISKNKIHYIYNPVIDESIDEKILQKPDHKWFDNKNFAIILGIGRITPQKDFETLIKAFDIVRKQKKAKLIILGKPDSSNAELEKLKILVSKLNINNDIDFFGFVENPFAFLANADLFVLSSRFEGLPGTLIQALYCGCPVVSVDCTTGPSEILENGKYGLLCKPGDYESLALNMLKTLEESKTKEELKSRGKLYSIQSSSELYYKLCLQLLRS